MADQTQDFTGCEQLSIVSRHVSHTLDLEVNEDFFGIYVLENETGLTISKAIEDACIQLQLGMNSNRDFGRIKRWIEYERSD